MSERDKIWRAIEEFADLRSSEFRTKMDEKALRKRLAKAGATDADIAKIILFKEDGNPSANTMKAFVATMER